MTAIGIIDDREDTRNTLRRRIEREIDGRLGVLATAPFADKADCLAWIRAQQIGAVVLDEKLHEAIGQSGEAVDYEGHDLVDYLRAVLPELPIWIVTSYAGEEPLLARYGSVEGILQRDDFYSKATAESERIARSAMRFVESNRRDLSRLTTLAEKIAQGVATSEEQEEAKALQGKLSVAVPVEAYLTRSNLLSETEAVLKKAEKLKAELAKAIQRGRGKAKTRGQS